MKQKKNQPIEKKERNYLENLQRESWNLELIISSLALFGIIALNDQLPTLGYLASITNASFFGGLLYTGGIIVYFCAIIVFANLIIHLLLRGLWIGAVGLRSVSGDINFYQLKLHQRFNHFLRSRIGSFDHYVISLDRVCSMIFAFSFLLVLLLIGFIAYWTSLSLLSYVSDGLNSIFPDSVATVITIIGLIAYLLFGLLYFIDFLSLGRIKRISWLSRFYYPFYRFFGFITLARIYRPLYYNFIDDKFGRKMIWVAIPYIGIILYTISLTPQSAFYDQDFFSDQASISNFYSQEKYYSNLDKKDRRSIPSFLLESDVVSKPYNKLSLYILPEHTEVIQQRCPDAPKLHDWVLASDFSIGFKNARRASSDSEKNEYDYISCFKDLFELHLNDVPISLEDAVLFHSQDYPYPKLVKYIPLYDQAKGLQQLKITSYKCIRHKDTLRANEVNIPFYYLPNGPSAPIEHLHPKDSLR